MLQTVLGVDAAHIARACMVAPDAMRKRLVRAKAKIKATGIRIEEPEARELPQRVHWVLQAVYGAYTLDWDHAAGHSEAGGLAAEALYLATLLVSLLPDEAEAWGLLALIEADASRRDARIDAQGRLVPVHEQDASARDAALIDRATAHLQHAATLHRIGPYQLEAAIQLAHASRRHGGPAPWADIEQLYGGLLARHPSAGAAIGHALAVAHAHDSPARGLQLLQAVAEPSRANHPPWWAATAHLLAWAGRRDEALQAYEQALALTRTPLLRRTLQARQQALAGTAH
jgi:RNA polymerase sigma-70 factor (ECF subfamily)